MVLEYRNELSLSADDMMQNLTNPILPLSEALKSADVCGHISAYKVNQFKTEIISLRMQSYE